MRHTREVRRLTRRLKATALFAVLTLAACTDSQDASSGPELAPESVASETVEATQEAAQSLVPPDSLVHLQVPEGAREGLSLFSVDSVGKGSVNADIVTLNGGSVTRGQVPNGGPAFEFPAYDDPSLGRRAILRIRNAGETDVLAPGEDSFEFGAEFRHDEATTGDPTDNGDNLIQRGLFGDGAQYKIDIDKRTPSCRIEGVSGVVQVKSSLQVEADGWYAARCSRQGDEVRLAILRYEEGRFKEVADDGGQGATGSITWEDAKQPMSVGGKLTVRGEVVEKASDQFNGAVADPYFTINE